ncbi:hypothetical protein DPM19_09560 [Actinomadura craniellae]|uniref:DUF4254 domain-containing protein n=1 Tax=Actinomadura craniellae TaxID=2231787 RepID=A0A365H7C7_9ACTN|nr:hypothetical protein [Actinomadura craniellae]RAY14987.1 hypothetical protein DPM19_09560 [Actinomadura craniellae]
MSLPLIRDTTARLSVPQLLPGRLAAAYRALEIAEYATRELIFLQPPDLPPGWAAAQQHAARARGALSRAPSFEWPLTFPPPVLALAEADLRTVVRALAGLADTLVMALVEAADQAEHADDEACCVQAALHGNDLHTVFHISARTLSAPEPA